MAPALSSDDVFQAAADTVQALVQAGQLTDQAIQLQLYGLYKQATCGDCNTTAPPFFQLAAKQKWSHWNALQGVGAQEARRRYVDVLTATVPDWHEGPNAVIPQSVKPSFGPVFSSLAGERPHNNDDDPLPPLHAAARVGDIDMLQRLLAEPGTDVNAADEEGCTPLHWAADGNHVEAVALLLRHGADQTLCDSHGDTAMSVAQLCNHRSVVDLLQGGE